jgi:Arc/MetJ-type ribon-helix-helix transcriptional regulator
MKVAVTPDLEKLIESEVQTGRFGNAEEFLKAAVEHYLIARDLGETYTREEIEQKIERGLAEIERGETVDGDDAFAQFRALSAARRQKRP